MIFDIPGERMTSNGDKGLNIVLEDWEGDIISFGEFPSPKNKNLSFLVISLSYEIRSLPFKRQKNEI